MKFIEVDPIGIVSLENVQVFKETMEALDLVEVEVMGQSGFEMTMIDISLNYIDVSWADPEHEECCGGGGYSLLLYFEDGKVYLSNSKEALEPKDGMVKELVDCILECDFRESHCGEVEDSEDYDDSLNDFEDESEDESEDEPEDESEDE
jgi:hypothetical protein